MMLFAPRAGRPATGSRPAGGGGEGAAASRGGGDRGGDDMACARARRSAHYDEVPSHEIETRPMMLDHQDGVRRSAQQSAAEAAKDLGAMPEWNLADLYAKPDAPEIARDLERARVEATRIKEATQGKLVAMAGDGGKLAEAVDRLRAALRPDGPAGLLRRAALLGRSGRSGAGEILRRHQREAHQHLVRADLLRARAQQDPGRCARRSAQASGAGALQALVRRLAGRRSPSSSRRRSSSCSTRSRRPGAGRGTGCSTRP